MDVNDNRPAFMSDSYSVKMRDPVHIGGFVIGTSALDPDKGSNGTVQYSLSGTNSDKFTINPSTGVYVILLAVIFAAHY